MIEHRKQTIFINVKLTNDLSVDDYFEAPPLTHTKVDAEFDLRPQVSKLIAAASLSPEARRALTRFIMATGVAQNLLLQDGRTVAADTLYDLAAKVDDLFDLQLMENKA
jgi:hypothetical protein